MSDVSEASMEWGWGYHYTPVRNLPSIEKSGLTPYDLHKEGIGIYRPGIWVWKDQAEGEDLAGIVIQRIIDHHAWEIALLRVKWREWDAYPKGPSLYHIRHRGTFTGNVGQSWDYHTDRAAYVIETPIPPKHIEVVSRLDVLRMVEEQINDRIERTAEGNRFPVGIHALRTGETNSGRRTVAVRNSSGSS